MWARSSRTSTWRCSSPGRRASPAASWSRWRHRSRWLPGASRVIARSCEAGRAAFSHRRATSSRPPRTSSACSRIPPCAATWAPPPPGACAATSTRAWWLRAWPGSTPRCCAMPAIHYPPVGRLTMNVPFFRPEIDDGDIAAVLDVLRSGWLTTGPRVKEFEASFARYVDAAHAVAVSSCTAALHLALAALGLRRGQGVVVPTLTFAATAEVVTYCDATPVFVDVEPETLCMDPAALESALARTSDRVTEIVGGIPVHYGGQMAAMPRLARALRAAGCFVVEDAAHALPAAGDDPAPGRGGHVGGLADVACFSVFPHKTLTTGEGPHPGPPATT